MTKVTQALLKDATYTSSKATEAAKQERMAVALETIAQRDKGAYESAQNAAASAAAAQESAANAASEAAAGVKSITGELSDLNTTVKTTLVAAINETRTATRDNATAIENLPKILTTLPTTYTLEESSNSKFDVTDKSAAAQVVNTMKGHLFLNKNGKTYAALLNSDWSGFADGTPVTSAIEAATETMIPLPKIYYSGEGKTVKIYGLQGPSTAKTYDGPHWIGAYIGSVNNGLHSRPNVTPAHSRTMSSFQAEAQKLGSDWGQWQYESWKMINLLYHGIYGNLNSQATIGAGWQATSTFPWDACRDVPMGYCKSLGNGSGSVLYHDETRGDQYPVKLFGFEDLWGKLWQFTPGIRYYMDGDVRHAVIYSGNKVDNAATGRDVSPVLSSAGGQYASKMHMGEYCDMICQEVNGSSTTYYCDGYWAATGGELLFVGAYADDGARCGIGFSASSYGFSSSSTYVGARLAFYGEPEIITGREMVALIG